MSRTTYYDSNGNQIYDEDVIAEIKKAAETEDDGTKEARLIYLLGQVKGVAACISEHRIRTTLTNAVNGVLAILQAPTGEEDMDK